MGTTAGSIAGLTGLGRDSKHGAGTNPKLCVRPTRLIKGGAWSGTHHGPASWHTGGAPRHKVGVHISQNEGQGTCDTVIEGGVKIDTSTNLTEVAKYDLKNKG